MRGSISEYFRLIHERDLLLEELKKHHPKSYKMQLLAELRDYDRLLEVDSGDYNSSDFGKVNK
jgi:hypothetical protein